MTQPTPTNTESYSDMCFTRTSVVNRLVSVLDDVTNNAAENAGVHLVEIGDVVSICSGGVHRGVDAHGLRDAFPTAVRVLTVDVEEIVVKIADSLSPTGFAQIDRDCVPLGEVVLDHGPEHWSIGLSYGGVAS